MKHLKALNLLNKIFAVLYFLGGAFSLYLTAQAASASPLVALIPTLLTASLVGVGALLWRMGGRLLLGQWKTAQIIVAVLCLSLFPLGTAYGIYALWAMLKSEEANKAYDEMSSLEVFA